MKQEILTTKNPRAHIQKTHKAFIQALLTWFGKAQRDLPWRVNYTPYEVWISEIMLQQTQMERGVSYFTHWMEKFPTIEAVAGASEQEVLKAWEGLGYYSRAKNIYKTAHIFVNEYQGVIPKSVKTLLSLPGIGPYTAGAIASIAYNKPVPAIDANVERVFSRIFDIAVPPKSPVAFSFIQVMAEGLVPKTAPRKWNQALMELGALICKKKPLCSTCPVQRWCAAKRLDIVDKRPVQGKKTKSTSLQMASGILVHNEQIFIQKRLETGVWAGLWEFPGGRVEEGENEITTIRREFLEETSFQLGAVEHLGVLQHAFTRYKIEVHCFLCFLRSTKEEHSKKPKEKLSEKRLEKCAGESPEESMVRQPTAEQVPSKSFLGKQISDLESINEQDLGIMPIPHLTAASAYRWVSLAELDTYPLPSVHRKALQMWQERINSVG